MFYTYVLLSKKDNRVYIGFTSDLKKRLQKHHFGEVNATKPRRPLTLIYFEVCFNKTDAVWREKYLKTGPGGRYLKKRLRYFLK